MAARYNRLNGEITTETTYTVRQVIDMWIAFRAKKMHMTRSSVLDEILEKGFESLGIDLKRWQQENPGLFDPTKE